MTPAACLAAVFAGLVALPLAIPLAVSAGDLGYLALFGAGQLALGMVMFTTGARFIPAAQAALLSVLETILGPIRSEERRVGKECVSKCRSRLSPSHSKKQH